MSKFSVAMVESIHEQALRHLVRNDGQEDLCFALWYPSQGRERFTGLVHRLILPEKGDRDVHGNVSFKHQYFLRVISEAMKAKVGIAFMHSHPGPGWQGMSRDDVKAETLIAPTVFGASELPLIGLTIGSDGAWSGRFWPRIASNKFQRQWCESVRIIGREFKITYMDELLPQPKFKRELTRTISAWGDAAQKKLARLRIGVVGIGSVGSIVVETLARMGVQHIKLIDYDRVEFINLDRLLHTTYEDAKRKRFKVDVLKDALVKSTTADRFEVDAIKASVAKDDGYFKALDCDILFSCVDRPLARSVLNFIAYAHLIPVIDGGIRVERNKRGQLAKADWKAHIASPGRRCLECLGQYNSGLVSLEREGMLEKPSYIQGLPEDHELRRNQNVFAFSLSLASMEVLQMLMMVVAPLGISDMGEQMFHFVPGIFDKPKWNELCQPSCLYQAMIAKGNSSGFKVTV